MSIKPKHYILFYSRINGNDDFDFDSLVKKFFQALFPLAYHHSIADSSASTTSPMPVGDFHGDYKNCLRHTFDDLQPFGHIPKTLAASLQQSLNAATLFVNALEQGAQVLAATEKIDSEYLSPKCKLHLLKMDYCSKCNGQRATGSGHVKSCFGYCTNVLR